MVAAEKAAQEADRQQRIQQEAVAIAEHNAREKEQREEFDSGGKGRKSKKV